MAGPIATASSGSGRAPSSFARWSRCRDQRGKQCVEVVTHPTRRRTILIKGPGQERTAQSDLDGASESCRVDLMHQLTGAGRLVEEAAKGRTDGTGLGYMRTEAILERFGVTEASWRDAAENNAEAKRYGFINSETPCFVGRAVAALAADPEVARWSGGVYSSWGLSEVYRFTDLDGRRPNIWSAVAAKFAGLVPAPRAAIQWQLTPARG
jgi:hypothetical protein